MEESKKAGEYSITNFRWGQYGVINDEVGLNNSGSGINRASVDSDSFLKNLHIKNSRKIVYNPILNKFKRDPMLIRSEPINIDTKTRRSCSESQDMTTRHYQFGVQDIQNHVNYNTGMDSRYEKR